ncbi:WGR domain-containing protein [Bosea sp. 2KB_26]|uniref:WGR domain-containing protein n=1 Tax=Bosea sp. 2KB_26 TaxID=3237475 RepID=UPI003F91C2D2
MEHVLEPPHYKLQMLVLERRDQARNMARFYVLAVEPTLFAEFALVREWGRWGNFGRRRLDLYGDLDEAAEALEEWLLRKMKRGYRIVCTVMGGNEPELDQGRAV